MEDFRCFQSEIRIAEAIKQKARNVAAGLCSAGFIVLPAVNREAYVLPAVNREACVLPAVNREACVLPAVNREACVLPAVTSSPRPPSDRVDMFSLSVLYHRPQTMLTCSLPVLYHRPQTMLTCSLSVLYHHPPRLC